MDKRYEGKWECFKYIKDSGNDNEMFSENYAKQFSHFAQFSLKKDSLILSNQCAKYVFSINTPQN